ncbi:ABC transporter ATP-binding protein [Antrihabitans cavernicola]|uniref:ATP-binding cassette domain-containing protein n=1 Tax=Antrihabitans cavernicola TaxID=2495913 RepID=A0A5A7SBK0_9NOCA|nr:ATP-binding cassette domain-containing protein [Spelaeibacter cavernicola]KAA0022532.1 ATP-binding cassette domain-containing protein [Spelaeibacter cavernicola]
MAAGVYLEVHGLTKKFGSVPAVDYVSFVVPPGSVTGFLGPNGAGKTTTLRMLLGLVTPSAGTATIGGRPFRQLDRPANVVGAVLDSLSLHPKRTALSHLKIFASAIGEPDSRAQQALSLVGLDDVARRRADTFSLGMRQRLALATALLGNPSVLVLDEPANGLDPEGIAWLREFLRSFARNGGTVLISSHILREIEQTVDNVVIVSRGRLAYQGSMADLRRAHRARVLVAAADPAGLATALAAQGITDAQVQFDGRLAIAGAAEAQIAYVASASGIAIFGMIAEQVDLEQVFLSMTSGQFAAPPPGYYGGRP